MGCVTHVQYANPASCAHEGEVPDRVKRHRLPWPERPTADRTDVERISLRDADQQQTKEKCGY